MGYICLLYFKDVTDSFLHVWLYKIRFKSVRDMWGYNPNTVTIKKYPCFLKQAMLLNHHLLFHYHLLTNYCLLGRAYLSDISEPGQPNWHHLFDVWYYKHDHSVW